MFITEEVHYHREQLVKTKTVTLTIDDYANDGGPGVVCLLCSFYHDPLRSKLFYLVRYATHIHRSASDSFSEYVQVISKPYDLK